MTLTARQKKTVAAHNEKISKFMRTQSGGYGAIWDGLGDFAQEMRNPPTDKLNRLSAAVSTAANSDSGSDGGFAVPESYRKEIIGTIKETSLLGLCDVTELSGPGSGMVTATDQSAPWDTSNGLQATWESEGVQLSPSKIALEQPETKLHKLSCFVPVSEELAEDATLLENYLKRQAAAKIGAAINLAIIRGTGVGMPLGILNSPCLVSVPAAATLIGSNVFSMHSRWHSEPRQGSWLISKSAEAQFLAAAGGAGLYDPSGHRVAGLPVVSSAGCSVLGDAGDIILADLSQYQITMRPLRMDVSTHTYMEYGLWLYRFILRIDGMPWWSAPADPLFGTDALSPFVTFDAR